MTLKPIPGMTTVFSISVFLPYLTKNDTDSDALVQKLQRRIRKIPNTRARPAVKGKAPADSSHFNICMRMGDDATVDLAAICNGARGLELYFDDFARNWDYGVELLMYDLKQLLGLQFATMLDLATLTHVDMRARIKGCRGSEVVAFETKGDGSVIPVRRAKRSRLQVPAELEISGCIKDRDFAETWINYRSSNPISGKELGKINPFKFVTLVPVQSSDDCWDPAKPTLMNTHSRSERIAEIKRFHQQLTATEFESWVAENSLDGWDADLVWSDLLGYLSYYLFPVLRPAMTDVD